MATRRVRLDTSRRRPFVWLINVGDEDCVRDALERAKDEWVQHLIRAAAARGDAYLAIARTQDACARDFLIWSTRPAKGYENEGITQTWDRVMDIFSDHLDAVLICTRPDRIRLERHCSRGHGRHPKFRGKRVVGTPSWRKPALRLVSA